MTYLITIRHSKNDRLLRHVEQEMHERMPGILSKITKDTITDRLKSWFQLEFVMECWALNELCERLFWAEIQIGYCLDIPISAIEEA